MKSEPVTKDVEQFHSLIIKLIKKYQFRDRNEVTSYGISVSQCYILETLHFNGPLTMKNLADKMHLTTSTITRVVDQLARKSLVKRVQGSSDLRVRLIRLTPKGEKIFLKSWENVFESEKNIFKNIKPEQRKLLINLLTELNNAVDEWQCSCKLN